MWENVYPLPEILYFKYKYKSRVDSGLGAPRYIHLLDLANKGKGRDSMAFDTKQCWAYSRVRF